MKRQVIIIGLIMLLLFPACGSSQTTGEGIPEKEQTAVQQDFYFQYKEWKFVVNEEVSALLTGLGEPQAFLENPSCALGDMARIYTYADFQLITYVKGEKEYLQSLLLKTDMVETPEGISLGDTKEKVRQVYGEPEEISGSLWIYKSGNGKLQILIKDSYVESIEYSTAYLND